MREAAPTRWIEGTQPPDLRPGERIERTWRGVLLGRWPPPLGRFFLTNQRLVFAPSVPFYMRPMLSRILDRSWEALLEEVLEVEEEPRQSLLRSLGPREPRVALRLLNGRRRTIEIWDDSPKEITELLATHVNRPKKRLDRAD